MSDRPAGSAARKLLMEMLAKQAARDGAEDTQGYRICLEAIPKPLSLREREGPALRQQRGRERVYAGCRTATVPKPSSPHRYAAGPPFSLREKEKKEPAKSHMRLPCEDTEAWARLRLGEGRAPRSPDAVFVAIERAVVLGADKAPVEGRLYRQNADGSLTPLDGPGLALMHERYPEFLRQWRLEDGE